MIKEELLALLRAKGYSDKIVSAFEKVNRESFIPFEYKKDAYEDIALPIGCGQTISQPSTIAFMLSLLDLKPRQKVMEVGSGSGYVLALISEMLINSEIYGVEIVPELVERSMSLLSAYENVSVRLAGPRLGLPEIAPFDRILVSASASEIPKSLLDQLGDEGIILCPVRDTIIKAAETNGDLNMEKYPGFAFVELK
jgi:protein-L-isoaspartate(D-aspartate) O-methyltransferase